MKNLLRILFILAVGLGLTYLIVWHVLGPVKYTPANPPPVPAGVPPLPVITKQTRPAPPHP